MGEEQKSVLETTIVAQVAKNAALRDMQDVIMADEAQKRMEHVLTQNMPKQVEQELDEK